MVMHNAEALDAVFHALADPTRRAMLRSLSSGPHTIGELAAPFDMSFTAASKHVRVLERAGLLRRSIQGRSHVCSLDLAPLAAAGQWLQFYQRLWDEQFDALDELLRSDELDRQPPLPTPGSPE